MCEQPEPVLSAEDHQALLIRRAVLEERARISGYIREMGEPSSGYYSTLRKSVDSPVTAQILFNRLATDINIGEHAQPVRVNNPELWK